MIKGEITEGNLLAFGAGVQEQDSAFSVDH